MSFDVVLIGSGFGSLTAAALLAKRGMKVAVLEQAKYAGGCSTSYKRKGYWFETGATTLVGLDEHMPLRHLLDVTGVEVPLQKLEVPMQVHLPDGEVITRYGDLEAWIAEAERVFGAHNQRPFWEHCYKISQGVWRTSLQQRSFPFSSASDLWRSAVKARPGQLQLLPGAFRTVQQMLERFGLAGNSRFVDFVNEQLLITAQNYAPEVNELFGATALCYTLYTNYYVNGGLVNLVNPVVNFIKNQGSEVLYRQQVQKIEPLAKGYKVFTTTGSYTCRFVISGIPLNNTAEIFQEPQVQAKLKPYILPSDKLNSAFTMALVLKEFPPQRVLHHQVHLPQPLPHIHSKSIFVSFSHPSDTQRAPAGETIVSISTHVADPDRNYIENKDAIEKAILEVLQERGLIPGHNISYRQSATPGAWIFWTQRAFGMVGGYPQYRHIKPWQMKDARLDHKGAYLCGDTVYPGQGIVGTCLSGIIAAHKLVQDHY